MYSKIIKLDYRKYLNSQNYEIDESRVEPPVENQVPEFECDMH